jgi:hypothetical protein
MGTGALASKRYKLSTSPEQEASIVASEDHTALRAASMRQDFGGEPESIRRASACRFLSLRHTSQRGPGSGRAAAAAAVAGSASVTPRVGGRAVGAQPKRTNPNRPEAHLRAATIK